ncbi:MAG TPA: glucokinase [Acetobacteraceae bacterium]|nr:glucokinase [Acetobacteraceae bacterium]
MSSTLDAPPPPGLRYGLVGDIGGTNCRLALAVLGGETIHLYGHKTLKLADFYTSESGIQHYLDEVRIKPEAAVLAVAGPVQDGRANLTNATWKLEEGDLRAALHIGNIRLINDFAATAFSAGILGTADFREIGPTVPGVPGATIAIMGPGTGFGLSALAGGHVEAMLVTEGGHANFAPSDEVDMEIVRILRARHGHVSVEYVLSGRGMENLHYAMEQMDGLPASGTSATDITEAAAKGEKRAMATVHRFCTIMASVAGDLALTLGAQGGVFIAGGIMPRLLPGLDHAAFRARFEDKGRFVSYLRAIPTRVITADDAALRGSARALRGL